MSQSSLQLLFWDIYHLSPGGTTSDDLLWDNDKESRVIVHCIQSVGALWAVDHWGAVTCRKNAVKHERWMHQGNSLLSPAKGFYSQDQSWHWDVNIFPLTDVAHRILPEIECTRQANPCAFPISHQFPLSRTCILLPEAWVKCAAFG